MIYRGYCPLGEPEVAIHVTNLLYDITLLLSRTTDSLSFSPLILGTHSYSPLLLYLCYHGFLYLFSLRHRRDAKVRACVLSRALWQLRRDSLAINPSHLRLPSLSPCYWRSFLVCDIFYNYGIFKSNHGWRKLSFYKNLFLFLWGMSFQIFLLNNRSFIDMFWNNIYLWLPFKIWKKL